MAAAVNAAIAAVCGELVSCRRWTRASTTADVEVAMTFLQVDLNSRSKVKNLSD